MNLADKPCYPMLQERYDYFGLTFRERLIIALASNSAIIEDIGGDTYSEIDRQFAIKIIQKADAIIKEMEK